MQGLWFGPLLAALVVTACGGDEMAKKQAVTLNLDATPAAPTEDGPASFALIGVANQGTLPATTSANSIVFALDQVTKLVVQSGPFAIVDAYGTDGSATVRLPAPDGAASGSFSMQARVLVDLPASDLQVACEADAKTGARFCSSTVIVTQVEGSAELDLANAVLELDVDGDGTLERLGLFDDRFQDIFWRGDEDGSRRAEVRFLARPSFASKSDDHCEYDCPKTPEKPKCEDGYCPDAPDTPKEPDYPKPTPKPTPKPQTPCCDCCCDDHPNTPHEPRDPDDPD